MTEWEMSRRREKAIAEARAAEEAKRLNGEIVRIGAAAGVPTPVNAVIRDRAIVAAAARVAPNSINTDPSA